MLDKHTIQTRDTTGKTDPTRARKWWLEPNDRQHNLLWDIIDSIKVKQRGRWLLQITYASLYENIARLGVGSRPAMVGFRVPNGGVIQADALGSGNKSAHNVIRSCINTCAARIAKNRPRIRVVTTEGSWSDQQRAKKLTQYLDGVFAESHAHKAGVRAFLYSLVFDGGFMHPFVEDGSIKVEWVLPLEVIVDDDDGLHGEPRQLTREKEMPREVLMAAYPECIDDLEHTPALPALNTNSSDNVLVREAWHLPSGPDADDGRHIIAVSNCTLLTERYDKRYFPLVMMRFTDRVSGYWGMGLCEELSGMQLRVNKTDKQILAAQQFMCVPRIFVEDGSIVDQHQLYDFGVVKYRGTPPVFNTSAGMAPEIYAERDKLIQRMYELSGVSQLAASAQKPAGLNSEPALREFNDQTSERFALQGSNYEEAYVELARMIIDMSRDMYKSDRGLAVKSKGRKSKFISTIKWADCDLDDQLFTMDTFPVSQLPTTPPGRLKFVQELLQAGFIERDTALELMELLDIEDQMSMSTAAYDCAMFFIEQALDEDEEPPHVEPYLNLQLTSKLAQACYLRACTQRAPESALERLRTFLEELRQETDRLSAQQAPQPGPGTPPGGAPMAQPAPAPTSDLLPIGGQQ